MPERRQGNADALKHAKLVAGSVSDSVKSANPDRETPSERTARVKAAARRMDSEWSEAAWSSAATDRAWASTARVNLSHLSQGSSKVKSVTPDCDTGPAPAAR